MGRGLAVQPQQIPVEFHFQFGPADSAASDFCGKQGCQFTFQTVLGQQTVEAGAAALGRVLLQITGSLFKKFPAGHGIKRTAEIAHRSILHGLIIEKQILSMKTTVVQPAESLNGTLHLAGQKPQGIRAESVERIVGRHFDHLGEFLLFYTINPVLTSIFGYFC